MRWHELLREDLSIVHERDPATRSTWSILTLHTGFWAVAHYRLQHALWQHGWQWLARLLSCLSRWLTGVEIHPAARAGRRLFIDHGMGIVIGETAELGDDVSIYQGVTLGGTSWSAGKRHPTIGHRVIIGAGAKILGDIVVGDDARVGSNAVVVKNVAAKTTVVGIPARTVNKAEDKDKYTSFEAYAQCHDMTDPVMNMLTTLNERISALEKENERLSDLIQGINRHEI